MAGTAAGSHQVGRDRRWVTLLVIALAQLMVALDATVVSIALPSAQAALHFSAADRQWVITAYTLAFGGLLLLGGRLADRWGRRRVFLAGLAGFALASAAGGAAPDLAVLIAARALQGLIAALLVPTALSLLAVTFTAPRERATAFAVYGGIAGSGAAIGLLLGGALTQYLDWRWCLYVNVPVAAVAAAGAWRLIPGEPAPGPASRLDVPGLVLVGAALLSLVYGCSSAVSAGWGSPRVLAMLAGSAVLLAGFVLRERRARAPLLPLSIVLDGTRAGSHLSVLMAMAGLFGGFLFISYYLQSVLGYSPLVAGLAFLPVTVASQLASWLVARRLMPSLPPRLLLAPGLLGAATGMALLTRLQAGGDYFTSVLPAEALLGFGTACAMVPAFSCATLGVAPRLAGMAAATVSAAQQVGASLGTAVLNGVAAAGAADYLAGRPAGRAAGAAALVHGFTGAAAWGAGILVAGALVAAALVRAPAPSRLLAGEQRPPEREQPTAADAA